MGLVSCKFCGNKVANQTRINCPKCGASYRTDKDNDAINLIGYSIFISVSLCIYSGFCALFDIDAKEYLIAFIVLTHLLLGALWVWVNLQDSNDKKKMLDQNQLPTPTPKSPKTVVTMVKTSYNPNRPTFKKNKSDSNKTSTKQGDDYIEGFY